MCVAFHGATGGSVSTAVQHCNKQAHPTRTVRTAYSSSCWFQSLLRLPDVTAARGVLGSGCSCGGCWCSAEDRPWWFCSCCSSSLLSSPAAGNAAASMLSVEPVQTGTRERQWTDKHTGDKRKCLCAVCERVCLQLLVFWHAHITALRTVSCAVMCEVW